ncbi:MAG TPA: low molecular weight protein-tyrosine-phosphatase [Patescibacteria group bacterium]|nr:low molecular weight protein-tyrosine-phosphatase [Patescibacteria group bacterium]
MVKVIFVCLGNICRSPMAEAVFQNMVDDAGLAGQFLIDSAGTSSWHIGEMAHSGTRNTLANHGILYRGRARRIHPDDIADDSSYIIAMDASNLADLRAQNSTHPRMFRLLEFTSGNDLGDVPDPYYQGKFEQVYQLVEDGCTGLLKIIRENEGI